MADKYHVTNLVTTSLSHPRAVASTTTCPFSAAPNGAGAL